MLALRSLRAPGTRSAVARAARRFVATDESYKILVVGGGPGGLSVASTLSRKMGEKAVAVVEPSEWHYYQPMWTLVGGGVKKDTESRRPMKDVMPSTATWVHGGAREFHPDENYIVVDGGKKIGYEFLIMAPGIEIKLGAIKGLEDALANHPNVSTNYLYQYAPKTFEMIKAFKEGDALFTFPTGPVKCAGAPQKIMYLAEDYWRTRSGVRDNVQVIYNTALPRIFGVEKYAEVLREVCERRDINVNYSMDLVEIRPDAREAVFRSVIDGKPEGDEQVMQYSIAHVTPKMGPRPEVAASKLADAAGFVDVDDHTLQHNKYRNVFSLGDGSSLPTSKTAAAVAEQSGVLKANLEAVLKGRVKPRRYNGYTSCPLTTGYNKLILAEFAYGGTPLETFPFCQGRERSMMYLLKRDVMPSLYWHGLLKGHWTGPGTFRTMSGYINAV